MQGVAGTGECAQVAVPDTGREAGSQRWWLSAPLCHGRGVPCGLLWQGRVVLSPRRSVPSSTMSWAPWSPTPMAAVTRPHMGSNPENLPPAKQGASPGVKSQAGSATRPERPSWAGPEAKQQCEGPSRQAVWGPERDDHSVLDAERAL